MHLSCQHFGFRFFASLLAGCKEVSDLLLTNCDLLFHTFPLPRLVKLLYQPPHVSVVLVENQLPLFLNHLLHFLHSFAFFFVCRVYSDRLNLERLNFGTNVVDNLDFLVAHNRAGCLRGCLSLTYLLKMDSASRFALVHNYFGNLPVAFEECPDFNNDLFIRRNALDKNSELTRLPDCLALLAQLAGGFSRCVSLRLLLGTELLPWLGEALLLPAGAALRHGAQLGGVEGELSLLELLERHLLTEVRLECQQLHTGVLLNFELLLKLSILRLLLQALLQLHEQGLRRNELLLDLSQLRVLLLQI